MTDNTVRFHFDLGAGRTVLLQDRGGYSYNGYVPSKRLLINLYNHLKVVLTSARAHAGELKPIILDNGTTTLYLKQGGQKTNLLTATDRVIDILVSDIYDIFKECGA